MKKDCLIIQDLYPLYIDNELQPEVRQWVDTHISECSRCQKGYEDGVPFSELLAASRKVPSEAVDKRIISWVRAVRLKVFALVTLVALIATLFAYDNQYQERRYILRNALQSYGLELHFVQSNFRLIKNSNQTHRHDSSFRLSNATSLIENALSNRERSHNEPVDIVIGDSSDQSLFATLTLLQYRANYGHWTTQDQAYVTKVVSQFEELRTEVNNLQPALSILGTLTSPLCLAELGRLTQELQEIGELYWLTNSFPGPGAISPLNNEQLSNMATNLFPNVEIIEWSSGGFTKTYYLEAELFPASIAVTQNSFTGQVYRIMGDDKFAHAEHSPREIDEVLNWLTRNFGESDFRITPAAGRWSYSVGLNGPVDIGDFMFLNWNSIINAPVKLETPFGRHLSSKLGDLDWDILTPQEVANIYQVPEGLEYHRTKMIHSAMTGELELAHEFRYLPQHNAAPLLLNAKTGLRDFSYDEIEVTF